MFSTERRQSLCGVNYIGGGLGLGFLSYGNYRCSSEEAAGFIGSEATAVNNSILMAYEESRDKGEESNNSREHTEQEDHERDKDWLQLSIGGPTQDPTTSKSGPGLVELALMPSSSVMRPIGPLQDFRAPRPAAMNYAALNNPSIVSHHQQLLHTANSGSKSLLLFQNRSEEAANNWGGFRPRVPISIAASNSSCSSSSSFSYPSSSALMAPSNYFSRPFNRYSELDTSQSWAGLDFRVVRPQLRRSHAGLWFMLQAMQNQEKEPYLPQIPKSYLRIKDGKMTIGLVMKYLVNKLNLDSESEVEIICKGQRVLPLMTLQHVRDSIWNNNNNNSTKDFICLLPNSSTTDYIMVLHYGRSAQT